MEAKQFLLAAFAETSLEIDAYVGLAMLNIYILYDM